MLTVNARLTITSSGSVGIGTSSPSELLHINRASGTGAYIRIQDASGGNYIGTDGGVLQFFDGSADEKMRIDSSGTVKISHADTASEGLRVIQTTAARTSGGALGLFYDDQSGTTQPTLVAQQNGTGDILQLFDGGSQVVTVKDGGNVGIGLTNPSDYYAENLVVAAPAEGGITIKSASTDQAYLMFADGTSGSDSYRGYIGHNHSTDATSLVSFGTIDLSSVAETVFTTASTERMRIDSSGRVGLGVSPISSPAGFSKTVLSLAGTAAPSVVLKQSTGNHMEWVYPQMAAGLGLRMVILCALSQIMTNA